MSSSTNQQAERYDAFISYRHVPKDRKLAIRLHRHLENYRTPPTLAAKGVPKRIKRVFRDEEELEASADLSDAIKSELQAARWLIVVCSPAAMTSKWINAEIEHFRLIKGSRHIIAVLVDGTPDTAFPPALRAVHAQQQAARAVRAADAAVGPPSLTDRGGEPGAPRFPAGFFKYRERKLTLLRVLAPLLSCRFDDLRRRDEERARRRARVAAAATVTGLVVLAAVGWRWQRGQIEELTTYSRDSLSRDPSRSLILSQLALERTRRLEAMTRWFGGSRDDAVRQSLEAAITQSQLRREFSMPREPVQAVVWDREGRVIAADFDGNVNVWDQSNGWLVSHRAFANGVQGLALRPDGSGNMVAMVTGQMSKLSGKLGNITILTLEGGQRDLHVWDRTSDSVRTRRLSTGQHSLYQAALAWCTSGDSSWLAAAAGTTEASLLNESAPALPQVLLMEGHTESQSEMWGAVNALAWNPDCTRLAAATSNGLYFTNGPASQVRLVLRSQSDKVNVSQDEAEGFLAVDWSRDGGLLAVGGQDSTVRLLTATGEPGQVLSGHQRPVKTVRWSHNGKRLATGGADGVVRVWDVPADSMQYKTTVGFYANQGEYVNGLAWSPDDTALATVGDDRTVRVWNVSTTAQPVTLFSRGGLLREGPEGRLTLNDRRLSDDELAELARQRAVRPLSAHEREQYLHSWFSGLLR